MCGQGGACGREVPRPGGQGCPDPTHYQQRGAGRGTHIPASSAFPVSRSGRGPPGPTSTAGGQLSGALAAGPCSLGWAPRARQAPSRRPGSQPPSFPGSPPGAPRLPPPQPQGCPPHLDHSLCPPSHSGLRLESGAPPYPPPVPRSEGVGDGEGTRAAGRCLSIQGAHRAREPGSGGRCVRREGRGGGPYPQAAAPGAHRAPCGPPGRAAGRARRREPLGGTVPASSGHSPGSRDRCPHLGRKQRGQQGQASGRQPSPSASPTPAKGLAPVPRWVGPSSLSDPDRREPGRQTPEPGRQTPETYGNSPAPPTPLGPAPAGAGPTGGN